MDLKGLAALRCWPTRVNLVGQHYIIPAKPALDWLIPIVDQDWLGIIPGMLDDSAEDFEDLLDDGVITITDCVNAARDAIGSASGMPWWSAYKLATAITGNSEIAAELVLRGVDPCKVSIGAILQASYRILVFDTDKKRRNKIDSELKRPPSEASPDGAKRYDPNVASDLFDQMARSRGMSG